MGIFQTLLTDPLINLLMAFYKVSFGNLGVALIALTVFLRLLLFPLVIPSLKFAQKQKEISGELKKLKEKYGKDKKRLAEKQMELYTKHGVNPASGCLPQIVQFAVLIGLYRVFFTVLGSGGEVVSSVNSRLYFSFLQLSQNQSINTHFLYWNLSMPDKYLILPILAGISQFLFSKFSLPQVKKEEIAAKKTKETKDDLMVGMQKQMLYMMPIMTVVIGYRFPSGLVLYWLVSTLLSFAQQLVVKKLMEKEALSN